MNLEKNILQSEAIKITAEENGKIIGHAYVYLIYNDLHKEPYGLLEDVFVEEEFRSAGLGTQLVQAVIKEARNKKCYKLIATSRESREGVHNWYEKIGFKKYGLEFRMNF